MELIQLLRTDPSVLLIAAGLTGLGIGSFLNIVITRLPKMMEIEWEEVCSPEEVVKPKFNLVTPRSCCAHCGHLIKFGERIPVISYLLLGGKCKQCKNPIGIRYPLVELISGLAVLLVFWKFGLSVTAFAAAIFVLAITALAVIDLETHLLPDAITLPLLWLGLLFNLNNGFVDIKSAVLGAAFGYLILWVAYWLFKLIVKKDGMGYGDFKMLSAVGAWFGWQVLPVTILVSSLAAAVVGIGMMILGNHTRQSQISFGPYMAIAAIIIVFLNTQI